MTKIDLMDSMEFRRRLGGISRQRAYQITTQANFPAPAAVLSLGRVWHTAEVEKWIAEWRPAAALASLTSPGSLTSGSRPARVPLRQPAP
ncbi:hypothetical protein [Actinoplanes sp. NPDC051494]|uniref:hypothetical protein n=1 Tax=Actinoplanes sp. NPDC051494 TaxID=3363907 RepID=UPI00379DCEE8